MLLPPDVREFVPDGHLARFIVEVVEDIDTSALHARHPNDREGRPAYNPDVLLALCLYGASAGIRSSRKLEALATVDLAARYITANTVPDHATIARFLRENERAFKAIFLEFLRLCAEAGMVRVGVVALDGTKVAANASLDANASKDRIAEEADAIVGEMLATDEEENARFGPDRRGDELPPDLADRRRRKQRLGRLNQALQRIDEREAEGNAELAARTERMKQAEAALTEAEAEAAQRVASWEAHRAETGRNPTGRPPVAVPERVRRARRRAAGARQAVERQRARAKAPKANTTDPDSRIMKTATGWVQGYNAQAVVTEDGVIVAAAVTDEPNDLAQFDPMVQAAQDNLATAGVEEPVGTVLADAGYCSEDNLTSPGPDRLIATTKSWKLKRKTQEEDRPSGPPSQSATPVEAMEHRLLTEEGEALYKLRSQTVEPVFGQIKEPRGLRRFRRRGRDAAESEWDLVCSVHNMLKLFRHRQRAPAVV
jgi:transposase